MRFLSLEIALPVNGEGLDAKISRPFQSNLTCVLKVDGNALAFNPLTL